MTPEILRQCLTAMPFTPFTMSLSDHNEVHVESTSEAEVSDDGQTMLVERNGARVIIALRHVVSISFDKRGGRSFGFGS